MNGLQEQQLDLFRSRVPHRPYCTDEWGTGIRVRDKETALCKRFIQANPPAKVGYIILDVDRVDAAWEWEARNLPPPSWAAINPANGHAHLAYAIKTPVVRTDAARLKPLKFLAAIQNAMTAQLGADFNYSGLMTKNPLNPAWRVISHGFAVYELHELAEYVDLKTPRVAKREAHGVGRNCELFDTLRHRAYRKVIGFREGGCFDTWNRYILDTARRLNNFNQPLPDSEVRAIAKSVSKWVWRYFGTGAAVEAFSERQRQRQRRSALARKGSAAAAIVQAVAGLQKAGERVTVSAVARVAGVSRPTVYKRRSLLTATILPDTLAPPSLTPPAKTVNLAKSDNSGFEGVSLALGGA